MTSSQSTRSAGFTIWLTGMSGAGKSTIATVLADELRASGHLVEVLDGDVVRTNLSSELGFSRADRDTNVRRIGWVCELLARNGVIAVVAAISPYRATRDEVRERLGRMVEVYVTAPLAVLEARDVKGLYRRARAGEIQQFTGLDDAYEPPLDPDAEVRSDGAETPRDGAARILDRARHKGYLA
ncbi:MAG: adenylyl-sulfate kinase [Chloroflexota bacterium]